jgi:hypothetical protein
VSRIHRKGNQPDTVSFGQRSLNFVHLRTHPRTRTRASCVDKIRDPIDAVQRGYAQKWRTSLIRQCEIGDDAEIVKLRLHTPASRHRE